MSCCRIWTQAPSPTGCTAALSAELAAARWGSLGRSSGASPRGASWTQHGTEEEEEHDEAHKNQVRHLEMMASNLPNNLTSVIIHIFIKALGDIQGADTRPLRPPVNAENPSSCS